MKPQGFILLVSLIVLQLCSSFDISQMQVDLVFPRNNSYYQRVWPFPTVFALQNFSAGWEYNPSFFWMLSRYNNLSGDYNEMDYAKMGQIERDNQSSPGSWGPPVDNYLSVNFTDAIWSNKASPWRLIYGFQLRPTNCTGYAVDRQELFAGFIDFHTISTKGLQPNMTGNGTCSIPLGAVQLMGPNRTNVHCPSILEPPPKPKSCALTIDKTAMDQIASATVEFADCDESGPRSTKQSFQSFKAQHALFGQSRSGESGRSLIVALLLTFVSLFVLT
jgi:hypothetical protein